MFLPHLKIESSEVTQYVLLPGDPDRVDIIGSQLDRFKILGKNREFKIGVGSYKGVAITVCSTGIGGPSTAIAVEELIDAGAKVLIRVGTCGGAWRSDISIGSLVLPSACVRDEGTTKEYIPEGFPAVADTEVVRALVGSAKSNKSRYFVGINRTHDAFYGFQESIRQWGNYLKEDRWRDADTPILSSDMESSILFVVASLRNVRAGAVLGVNADPEPLREKIVGDTQKVVAELNEQITLEVTRSITAVALDAIIVLNT